MQYRLFSTERSVWLRLGIWSEKMDKHLVVLNQLQHCVQAVWPPIQHTLRIWWRWTALFSVFRIPLFPCLRQLLLQQLASSVKVQSSHTIHLTLHWFIANSNHHGGMKANTNRATNSHPQCVMSRLTYHVTEVAQFTIRWPAAIFAYFYSKTTFAQTLPWCFFLYSVESTGNNLPCNNKSHLTSHSRPAKTLQNSQIIRPWPSNSMPMYPVMIASYISLGHSNSRVSNSYIGFDRAFNFPVILKPSAVLHSNVHIPTLHCRNVLNSCLSCLPEINRSRRFVSNSWKTARQGGVESRAGRHRTFERHSRCYQLAVGRRGNCIKHKSRTGEGGSWKSERRNEKCIAVEVE